MGARRGTLVVVSAATLLALMNYTAPMMVLPDLAAALGAGDGGRTWILNGTPLGLSALLLITGNLADDYGRRRVFAGGAVLLGLGSVLCAVASTTSVFVAGRLVQGAATAAVISAGLGLLAHAYPDARARAQATSTWAAMLGGGIALGPLVAAGSAQVVGWRPFYAGLAAVSLVLAAVVRGKLPESRAATHRAVDLPGMVTLTTGLVLLLTALTLGRNGWLQPVVLWSVTGSVVALVLFVLLERRRREPMLDLSLFGHRGFVTATVSSLLSGLAVIALMTYLPGVVQPATGLTPLATGGVFTCWSATSFLVSLWLGRVRWSASPRIRLAWGMGLAVVADLVMLGALDSGSWARLVPGLVIAGVSSGIVNASLAGLAVGTVPADRASMGSAANNTARYIGSALGVALIAAFVPSSGAAPAALAAGADLAMLVTAAFAGAGALLPLVLGDRTVGPRATRELAKSG